MGRRWELELTTADQRLVTKKNAKVRRVRELYPEVEVLVVYQRDFLALVEHHGLDQAAVSVNFAEQRANHVLSVPVTALLATGGGNYAVQEAGAPRRLIPVTTGLFAAGYVQISGAGIYPGLQVTDSQG